MKILANIKRFKKKVSWIIFMLVSCGGMVFFSLNALRQNINLFFTPSQLSAAHLETDEFLRLGGMVQLGSLKTVAKSLQVEFILADQLNHLTVSYHGVLPNLFREGQQVVVEGHLRKNGIFHAVRVLAKHDERYSSSSV